MYWTVCRCVKYDGESVMDKVKRVEAVSPVPSAVNCKHDHWRVYQSFGYRECDKCKEKRPIFNVVKHQR